MHKWKVKFEKVRIDWQRKKFTRVGEIEYAIKAKYYAPATEKANEMLGTEIFPGIFLGTFLNIRPLEKS